MQKVKNNDKEIIESNKRIKEYKLLFKEDKNIEVNNSEHIKDPLNLIDSINYEIIGKIQNFLLLQRN